MAKMRGKVQLDVLVNKLYAANDAGVDAAIFNPAAFGSGYPAGRPRRPPR